MPAPRPLPRAVFRQAHPEDEEELRRLTALPMPGDWLELSYQREPNFFGGLLGSEDEVLVGRFPDGPLAAMAIRSPRAVYQNGLAREVGYLSGLRVDPRFQGGTMLWRGYQLLAQMQQHRPLGEHLATIVEGNQMARSLLVQKPRPSWPRFTPYQKLHTLALRVGRKYSLRDLESGPCEAESFLQQYGACRQYFPARFEHHPEGESRTWLRHPQGVAALRDLSRCRQTVVHRYRAPFSYLRPIYNLWARPQLPSTGQALRGVYAGFFCALDPRAFVRLLEGLLECARLQGKDWLYLGLLEDDPHFRWALSFPHKQYLSTVYRIAWPDQDLPALDGRPGYLELATL